jgi:hypothetical protein
MKSQIAFFLVLLLTTPLDIFAAAKPELQPQGANTTQPSSYPDSPGTTRLQSAGEHESTQQSAPANPQNSKVPVGTAAAPYVKPEGVAASRPAGAAIAPAKQKRSHSFALRVGLIVGAGIAIGTVTALSLSSSSRPH